MKLATIKRQKTKGKQHGYHILIYQIRYQHPCKMDDDKICETFVSANSREGKKELAKALQELSEMGIH